MTKTQRVKVGNPKSQKKRRQNTVKTSKTKSFIKKFCVFALKFSLILFLFISMITVCAVVYYLDDLPDISNLEGTTKKPNVTIYAQDNTIIGNYGDIQGEFLTYSQLPISAIYALLATEDQRFFDHNGVDILGVIRAAYHNYKAGRIVEGGSTITQQLAKILFLSPEKTFKRKIQEVLLAWKIEQQFSKEQILSIYLNKVFLGQGNFGIDAAAHYYFGKSGKDLNLYESAALIGMLKAPSKYSVTSNHIGTIQRARQVLFNMENRGFIKPKDIQFAVPPVFLKKGLTRGVLKNPYFTDYIMEEVVHMLGTIDRDLDIYTTLDLNKQTALESAIVKNMQKLNKSYNVTQAAGIIMKDDGAVKAMMGGVSYKDNQFNRAVNAKRQPGSAFKLFVYGAALEHGYNIESIVEDKPITIGNWSPKNFTRSYKGRMRLKQSFEESINTIAVQLMQDVGTSNVINFAHKLGVTEKLPNFPSLALGTKEIPMLEMTASYGAISNGGLKVTPYAITKIIDRTANKVLFSYNSKKDVVLTSDIRSQLLSLLEASINNGTSKGADINGMKVFGKTGTSQDFRDAWFFGFTSNLVASIWVGNDNNTHMKGITGGKLPALIWHDTMVEIFEKK